MNQKKLEKEEKSNKSIQKIKKQPEMTNQKRKTNSMEQMKR